MTTASPPPARYELRQRLAVEFPELDDFLAFLRAAHPTVYREISPAMGRTAITNVLLTLIEPAEVVAALARYRPPA